ncbi:uncharacterized protein LOC114250160 [Bombyx mandarina]|uniref:UMA domain-containing protein n=2 Tax=Bombyx TaxID=7090 RepID=A0A8R1WI63_BOMMO|nr:uncharacterized protein LOC101740630 [Bombyx mori]XP_028039720.1 uncharacterized protein LOC114250160 [Bombyx mandarina]
MFSSFFGKRRSSPVEDETPPIPGPKSDDGFVVVDPTSPRGSIYPSVGPGSSPYPQRPAPAAPLPRPRAEQPFHYLQGVPFSMSKELQMSANKDSYAREISDLLAFLTNKITMNNYEYDFSVERSVIKEC